MATAGPGCSRSHTVDPGERRANEEDKRIDKLNFMQTMREGKTRGITFDESHNLMERQWLLKYKTLCSGATVQKPADVLKTMTNDAFFDKDRRIQLIEELKRAICMLTKVLDSRDCLATRLEHEGYASGKPLQDEIVRLRTDEAPILVLGETGSGKSSFLNLLLGNDFLPKSILSNTHVVSKIKHGDKPKAYLYKQDALLHTIENLNEDDFKKELAKHVQKTDRGRASYSLAEIYLPCDVLECGLVIVDSPGIGETDEMEQMVLDYILKACTFIYIIDSMTAGGVQLRMQTLLEKAYAKAMEEEKIYNPETAIFICNKWDLVDQRYRDEVRKDAETKITRLWPNCKNEQIFVLSTAEALFIQQYGGIAPKFLPILKQINRLLPLGREVLVRKSYNKLEQFYCRCLMMMWAFKHQSGNSDDERHTEIKRIKERLKHTCVMIDTHHTQTTDWLQKEIQTKADELKRFMNSTESQAAICNLPSSELPKSRDWETASVEVRYLVHKRVEEIMASWIEKEGTFKDVAAKLYTRVRKKFPVFLNDIADIQMDISPFHASANHLLQMEEEFTLLPKVISDTLEGSLLKKVALGTLMSPALLFLAIGRGANMLRLKIVQTIDEHSKQSSYTKAYALQTDRKTFCEDYARKEVEKVLKGADFEAIAKENFLPAFTYLKKLRDKMKQVVKQDQKLMGALELDNRSAEEKRKVYEPMIGEFEEGLALLHTYSENVFYKDTPVDNIQELPPTGWTASRIFKATSVKPYKTKGYNTVWLHKSATETTEMEGIKTLTAYRELSHASIVKCLGSTEVQGTRYQLMAPLVRPMRSYLSGVVDNKRMAICSKASIDMVSGLSYLHQRGYVHYDLSLDTIFVDEAGCAKLTNINVEGTSVQVDLVPHAEGFVFPGHYVHLPLKFLYPRRDHGQAVAESYVLQYKTQDDMYSVGILMWEMYLERHLVNLEDRLDTGFGESDYQVGGQVATSNRHVTYSQGSTSSRTVDLDEGEKYYKLLRETLYELISVRRTELTSKEIAEDFWKAWRGHLFDSLDGKIAAGDLEARLRETAWLMRT